MIPLAVWIVIPAVVPVLFPNEPVVVPVRGGGARIVPWRRDRVLPPVFPPVDEECACREEDEASNEIPDPPACPCAAAGAEDDITLADGGENENWRCCWLFAFAEEGWCKPAGWRYGCPPSLEL